MIAAWEKNKVSSLRERLYELMDILGIVGQENFANYVDISFNTLKEVFRDKSGKRLLSHDNIQKIVDKCRCDHTWLVSGKGTPFSGEDGAWSSPPAPDPCVPIPSDLVRTDQVIFIPKIRPNLLINGELPRQGSEVEWFAWPQAFLSNLCGNPDTLRILRHEDDMMYPVLKKDDVILIDCAHTVIEGGAIYAFVIGNALMVSELDVLPKERVMVRPHNPIYSSFDIAGGAVRIIGRCIWYGRML